jgi:hypothetical protein
MRLTEYERKKANMLAHLVDCSEHEWPKDQYEIQLLCHGYLDRVADNHNLRARIADLEAERDAALNRAREARETAENYLGHCDAACKQLEVVEAERDNAVRYTELLIQERDNAKSKELEVLRLRIAEVEGERDAAKAGEENLKRKWQIEECAHCGERPGGHQGTIWCAECFEWWVRESEKEYIDQLRADLDAARAGEARAVEALEAARERCDWWHADDCPWDGPRNTCTCEYRQLVQEVALILSSAQPAFDWLAQREREAAARELEGLMESEWRWEEFGLKASIHARIADLRDEHHTACARSEVWGKEKENND